MGKEFDKRTEDAAILFASKSFSPVSRLFNQPQRHRGFKLFFIPVLFFSFVGQVAVVLTQLDDIRAGYFDFVLYYSAARIFNEGKGAELYDLRVQREYQKGFGVAKNDRDLPFNHLPFELLALLIPAKFSFPAAHLIWAVLNMLLLAIVLLRLFPFIETGNRSLLALMMFAYFPTLTALKMGQDSVLTTFLLAETYGSLKRRRYALAGALLACGLYKPQLVLPIAGIFFLHRRWSAALGFLGTGLFLTALSLAMVGRDGLLGLFSLWMPMTQRGNVVWPELMINLRGLVYMILSLCDWSEATNLVTVAMSVLIYGLTLRMWPSETDERGPDFDLRFALALAMTALVSFHLYSYDSAFLIIPLALTLNRVLKEADFHMLRHKVFLAIMVGWFIPLLPNVLLSAAALAWWALPLPILFTVIALEISRGHSEWPDAE